MPYIKTTTNIEISNEQELALKEAFGKNISILGKTESWLMLSFHDNSKMYFKGDNKDNYAMIEISVFGNINSSQANDMTFEVCKFVENILGISTSNIYVKYDGIENWGWNGQNF